ncbi:MAG: protein-tyrosine phosphatase family protein, partial [Janthinobacterium lividum]
MAPDMIPRLGVAAARLAALPPAAQQIPPHDAPAARSPGAAPGTAPPQSHSARSALHALWREKQSALEQVTPLSRALSGFDALLNKHQTMSQADCQLPLLNWQHDTAIKIDGNRINAHHIYASGRSGQRQGAPVGCITAYPKNFAALKQHIQLLHQIKPSVLVVLANDAEINYTTAGYFRKNGIHGDFEVISVRRQPPAQAGAGAAAMPEVEHHVLTIRRRAGAGRPGAAPGADEAQETIEIPVIYVPGWPDGTALLPEELEHVIQQILAVERSGQNGALPRRPLMHCMEGLGRAGQCMAHYLMKKDPARAKSAENVVQNLKQSRSTRMVYALPQKNSLGEAAAAMGLPKLAISRPDSLSAFLHHLDITNLRSLPDFKLLDMLGALKFESVTHLLDPQPALALLQQSQEHDCPLLMAGKKERAILFQYLWSSPRGAEGKSLSDGTVTAQTAQQFLQEHVDAGSLDTVKLIFLPPAREIGDMALLTNLPRQHLQARLLVDLLFARPTAMAHARQMCSFLNQHAIATHAVTLATDALVANKAAIAAALASCSNFMLEFRDHRQADAPLVRYTFRDQHTVTDGWLQALRYTPLVGVEEIHFPSF